MTARRLSDTSFAVLGLVDLCGPTTAYRLKQTAKASLFHLWSIPHTQLYTECARLAEAGLLDERREDGGRRRRVYRVSAKGRRKLEAWRAEPTADVSELRNPGLLKLFCGAQPASVAELQLETHEQRLAHYRELLERTELPDGVRLTIEAGIGHEREYIRFWSRLRKAR